MPVREKERFLVFGSPYVGEEEIEEVVDSLRSGWLGTGPKVAAFEAGFAAYKEAGFAAAFNSCTAALHLSLVALNLQPGDEVITTPLTFCASVNAIIHAGATPVLADVNPHTMNIDPDRIREKITDRTRAILPVHFAGRSCDMDGLVGLCQEFDLRMVEDCAHAIETRYKGRHAGTFGEFGCFSFYVTKNVVTGEGGMTLCRRQEDIERIKVLGLHGMSADAWKRFTDAGYKHYMVVEAGYKYNMMDLQAAIGIHQLKRVEETLVRRREIWARYDETLSDLPLTLPAPEEPDTVHARHLYTVLVDQEETGVTRDEFLSRMHAQNIGTGVHYLSIPEHPYYRERFGWKLEETPEAVRIGRQTVSLPLSPRLKDSDIDDVIEAVHLCLDQH
ncbi:MAG: DegT/DnrJ/EryC1/StrS family aminotransferase [Proteobacteria bacterium]|nr:DegT/DnrJ/EryC1/StrS family aminotransferase [Pseudomonadota bacterium]MBU1611224.1 DegT/DnrJ/EryC1/StrS family aminotransferase [Pseudomonadota bacterium]